MNFVKPRTFVLGLVLASVPVFAQGNTPAPQSGSGAPQVAKPEAPAQPSTAKKTDHAAAYYHYAMAHMYEEMVTVYGRSEYLSKAIEEYRLALENDPSSEFLSSGLAELYARTGRIRDAVSEAQDIINRDPSNLDARKLLGRIYLRSIGDAQSGSQSQEVLKLAIEQYESIVKLEPNSADNHLVLGRLYLISKDLQKAEGEFKTAVKLEPTSEEAVSTLAYLYNEEGDTTRAVEVLNSVPEGARSAKLYSALGFTYEQKKDYPNAVAAYKQAISLDHDNLDAVRGLAQNPWRNSRRRKRWRRTCLRSRTTKLSFSTPRASTKSPRKRCKSCSPAPPNPPATIRRRKKATAPFLWSGSATSTARRTVPCWRLRLSAR